MVPGAPGEKLAGVWRRGPGQFFGGVLPGPAGLGDVDPQVAEVIVKLLGQPAAQGLVGGEQSGRVLAGIRSRGCAEVIPADVDGMPHAFEVGPEILQAVLLIPEPG